MTLTANGPFRPNVPIDVHAIVRAQRQTAQTRVELIALDSRDAVISPRASARPLRRRVGQWAGALGVNATTRLDASVTFSEPGYYKVLARSTSDRPANESLAHDSVVVLDSTYETLYLVVDEKGGRLTHGFEAAVANDARREPLFGSFGPFVERAPGRRTLDALPASFRTATVITPTSNPDGAPRAPGVASTSAVGGRGATASSVTCAGCDYPGTVMYQNDDLGGQTVPLAQALVVGQCYDENGQLYFDADSSSYYVSATTDSLGAYLLHCPEGNTGVTQNVWLQNSIAYVYGNGGAGVTAGIDATPSSAPTAFIIGNRYAAHVYATLNKYVPRAFARFGRTRSAVSAFVNDDPADASTAYYTSNGDIIRTNTNAPVFSEDGLFTTMHEYGHSFQYWAIEPWRSYTCNGTVHYVDVAYGLSCAYVEGFADFFSSWIAGDALRYAYFNDYKFEHNSWYSTGDGSKTEANVAALFTDLVDGPNEPDALSGGSDGVDDDAVTFPASYVASVMQTCSVNSQTRLDGIDEFIYCAEHNVGARTANPYASWRTYSVFNEAATEPPTWSALAVRTVWRRDLYNLNP